MISQDQIGGTHTYESVTTRTVQIGWWVRVGQTYMLVSDVYVDEVLNVVIFTFDHGDYSTTLTYDPGASIQVRH